MSINGTCHEAPPHQQYVEEGEYPAPRPCVAFEEDYAFDACPGHIIGEEVCGTGQSHCRRYIFRPSEPITRRGTGKRAWGMLHGRFYLPLRKVRFTDDNGTAPATT